MFLPSALQTAGVQSYLHIASDGSPTRPRTASLLAQAASYHVAMELQPLRSPRPTSSPRRTCTGSGGRHQMQRTAGSKCSARWPAAARQLALRRAVDLQRAVRWPSEPPLLQPRDNRTSHVWPSPLANRDDDLARERNGQLTVGTAPRPAGARRRVVPPGRQAAPHRIVHLAAENGRGGREHCRLAAWRERCGSSRSRGTPDSPAPALPRRLDATDARSQALESRPQLARPAARAYQTPFPRPARPSCRPHPRPPSPCCSAPSP